MDYKELEKQWQKDLPEEANGLTKRKPMPKRWLMKLKSFYRKKNINKEKS
jgi:hypothetical protein